MVLFLNIILFYLYFSEDEGLNEIRILNDIEKEIVRLEQEQKKIHSERISRVDKDIKSVLNSQSVNVLQHINKIPTNTICSLCATDFLPCFLNMLDNKTEEKVDVNTYLMSCIRCAGRICFKCTFKIITLNPLHNNSIGMFFFFFLLLINFILIN